LSSELKTLVRGVLFKSPSTRLVEDDHEASMGDAATAAAAAAAAAVMSSTPVSSKG